MERPQKSKNQRRIRIPTNSRVRRQLFPEDNIKDQARIDNVANILQESAAMERQALSEKYNFDFVNEKALDGEWEWEYRANEDKWIGMKVKVNKDVPENEKTPVQVRSKSLPPLRKRKRDGVSDIGNPAVRRRLLT